MHNYTFPEFKPFFHERLHKPALYLFEKVWFLRKGTKINESGNESHRGRMVKRGSSQRRYTLINCCQPLIRFDITFATYNAKKLREIKPHQVAIAHAPKKIINLS